MVIRSACHGSAPAARRSLSMLGGALLAATVAGQAAAQAGYPQPAPQPQQPYVQPSPVPAQPIYQQPAPQPQPYAQPAPQPAPGQPPAYQPQPQPAPFGAQPVPAPAPSGYAPFPAPVPDTTPQPPGGIPEGAFQLGLFTTIVRYEPLHLEAENNGGEQDVSVLKWGLAENPIVIEMGYGLSDMIVLGGTLGLGGESTTVESPGAADAESSSFHFELGPKLDFMFSPGAKVNPFVGANILVQIDSSDTGTDQSITSFLFLARVGLRAFLTDSFSIDPALVAGGGFGSGSNEGAGGDVDFDVSGFRIGLNIGFSGWML